MGFDRKYLLFSLGYVAVGMGLGVYMGASKNHGQLVPHTHILLLVGFVESFIYGLIHKLWLQAPGRGLANAQFVLHEASAVVMIVGLFALFGGLVPEGAMGPVLGIASVAVLLAALWMIALVLKFPAKANA
ncbi:MAG: hypothetical protein JO006_00710 [Paucibacter sp.]|nr:hypothetical protein [Roseateles sp.]